MVNLNLRMKQIANWALNVATMRGASYADARIVSQRSRALTTKNGKVGSASDAESVGMSVRVIADGAWGFAASEELDRCGVEATAARAVEIARASAQVKQEDVRLAAEKPVAAEWTTPHTIDPFSISVEQNIALLLKIDSELRAVAGITLAETNLNFNREEQWFRFVGGKRHSSDEVFGRRGLHGVCVCRQRDSEALLSKFLWGTVAEQRIRTH